MSALQLRNIKKRFGPIETIHGIDLDIAAGEFVVFVGPSGCGKTTLLRMIAGLEDASEGSIQIGARDVTTAPPSARKVAMVFQSYALYPHMTVRENLSFGMRMRGIDKTVIAQKLAMAIDILRLAPYLDRLPGTLSGGQAQRVAIGRALVQEPEVFLFDEPLSNLDAELRLSTRIEIAALHKRLGKTMIYVTHDQVEAMSLAEKIVVLRDGRIEQVGAPLALYHAPKNTFVAGFIGSPAMTLLPADFVGEANGWRAVIATGASIPLPAGGHYPDRGSIGVRPEHWLRVTEGGIETTVLAVERLGAITYVYAALAGERVCVEMRGDAAPAAGEKLRLAVDSINVHGFDGAGLRLRA